MVNAQAGLVAVDQVEIVDSSFCLIPVAPDESSQQAYEVGLVYGIVWGHGESSCALALTTKYCCGDCACDAAHGASSGCRMGLPLLEQHKTQNKLLQFSIIGEPLQLGFEMSASVNEEEPAQFVTVGEVASCFHSTSYQYFLHYLVHPIAHALQLAVHYIMA